MFGIRRTRVTADHVPGQPLKTGLLGILSILLLGACVVGWIIVVLATFYAPAIVDTLEMASDVTASAALHTAARFGQWMQDGGWRLVVPIGGVITLAALVFRFTMLWRIHRWRAGRRSAPPARSAK